jgi:hypothetical protein
MKSVIQSLVIFLLASSLWGCATTGTTTKTVDMTDPSLTSYPLIVRPVGNPYPTPPEKYPDFLKKVGGTVLEYSHTQDDKAYVFNTEPTTMPRLKRTVERLKNHPYIRYVKIGNKDKI